MTLREARLADPQIPIDSARLIAESNARAGAPRSFSYDTLTTCLPGAAGVKDRA